MGKNEKRAKRTCAEPRCETILCSYNPRRRCALHGGWVVRATEKEQAEAFGELVRS